MPSAFQNPGAVAAGVAYGGSSGIAAGNVEAALDELDLEKIAAAIVDAKGDLIVATAADTLDRLAVGANGTFLLADSAAGGGASWALPVVPHGKAVGSYYTCAPGPPADNTYPTTKDLAVYTPFPVYEAMTIDRISLGVQAAGGASSVVRLGIYQAGSDGKPNTLLLDAGTINGTSATYQEITISQLLAARTLYFTCVVWQVGTAGTVRATGIGAGSDYVAMDTNARDPRSCSYTEAGVTGALPPTATPGATPITAAPAVKYRVA